MLGCVCVCVRARACVCLWVRMCRKHISKRPHKLFKVCSRPKTDWHLHCHTFIILGHFDKIRPLSQKWTLSKKKVTFTKLGHCHKIGPYSQNRTTSTKLDCFNKTGGIF